jgi:hypothetical protein
MLTPSCVTLDDRWTSTVERPKTQTSLTITFWMSPGGSVPATAECPPGPDLHAANLLRNLGHHLARPGLYTAVLHLPLVVPFFETRTKITACCGAKLLSGCIK